MPIFARPNSDIASSGWSDQSGGTTNIFQSIDEAVENLSDYIKTLVQDVPFVYQAGLSAVADPLVSTGHILTVTAAQLNCPGVQNVLIFKLKQGATLIATGNQSLTNNTTITYTLTLSSGEADAITNYGGLSLTVEGLKITELDFDLRVYHAHFQVPGFKHMDISNSGLINAAADSGNILQASDSGLIRSAGTEGTGTIVLPTSGGGLKVT